MPWEDFELQAHLLARAAYPYPTVEKTASPDNGADTLLPKARGGGWSRAWQAKRHGGSIDWDDCVESLNRATKAYRVDHYTLVFPQNLTGLKLTTFNERLRDPNPTMTVDWWGLTELMYRLEDTVGGKRVQRFMWGPRREDEQLAWRDAMALGGELEGVDDLLGRLERLGSWLERRDDGRFAYASHTWQAGQSVPSVAPETFLTMATLGEAGGQRIDVSAGANAGEGPFAQMRVEFTANDEGRRAAELWERAERQGVAVDITSGVRVTWEVLPDLFEAHVGRTTPATLQLKPLLPDVPPWRSYLRAETGGNLEVLDVSLELTDLGGWEVAWRGRFAGLTATLALRQRAEGGGEMMFNVNHELNSEDPAREQLQAMKWMQALYAPGTLVIGDRERPERKLNLTLNNEGGQDRLDGLIATIGALVAIEDWTGERFAVPEEMSPETAAWLGQLAGGIRAGGWPGVLVGDILVPDTPQYRDRLAKGNVFRLHQEIGVQLLGREVWLGVLDFDLTDFELAESAEPGKFIVRPKHEQGRRLTGRLRRGKLQDVPVPPGFSGSPAEHRWPSQSKWANSLEGRSPDDDG